MQSIDSLNISWARTRVHPTRVLTGSGSPAVSRAGDYQQAYARAAEGAPWQRPWIGEESFSHFWAGALGDGYRSATSSKAWKRQVPLRQGSTPDLASVLDGVRLTSARFLYPTGVGVLVNAEVSGAFDRRKVLALAGRLASEPTVAVAGAPPMAMAAVLGGMLDATDVAVLGGADPKAPPTLGTQTVATVTGTTGYSWAPIKQGDPVHRLLAGLCQLSAAPLDGPLGSLATMKMDDAERWLGSVRAARVGGRAVWSPASSAGGSGSTRLRCYHRNLALVTMQTDLFLGTAQWVAGLAPGQLTDSVKAAVQPVLNLLGMLYGKAPDIYTSRFVRRQIDDSGLVDTISGLRVGLGVGGRLS